MMRIKGTFQVTVNYDLSVEEAVSLGKYDIVHPDFASVHFPAERNGTMNIAVEILWFSYLATLDETLEDIEGWGFRPATLRELLAIGAQYPNYQREHWIEALGSIGRDHRGNRVVPGLCGAGFDDRRLVPYSADGDHGEIVRLAVVRK